MLILCPLPGIESNIRMDVANLLALDKNRVQLMLVWM
jgi:hypothetical protein